MRPGESSIMMDETPNNHERLVDTVSRAPDRQWAESYFELGSDLISETGLGSDDPRLVMSLPRKGTLPITVNNRYVLVAFRDGKSGTEFILPGDQGGVHQYLSRSANKIRFNAIYDEHESKRPWLVRFDGNPQTSADDRFRRFWLTAVKTEMARIEKSPYRRYHQPAFYRAAADPDYREHVFSEAFD